MNNICCYYFLDVNLTWDNTLNFDKNIDRGSYCDDNCRRKEAMDDESVKVAFSDSLISPKTVM